VLLDVQFTNFQGGSAPVPPAAVKLREAAIGVFGSYEMPDYGSEGNVGVGAWATFTGNYFGVQADAEDTVDSRAGIRERSIVVGPRIQLRTHGVTFYAKAQAGAGHFSGDIYNTVSNKTTKVIEQYGGGVELNPTKHLKVRLADYSYQVWPEFSPTNLTPSIVSSGFALRF
jgi:opacity protein-like surface antigen